MIVFYTKLSRLRNNIKFTKTWKQQLAEQRTKKIFFITPLVFSVITSIMTALFGIHVDRMRNFQFNLARENGKNQP